VAVDDVDILHVKRINCSGSYKYRYRGFIVTYNKCILTHQYSPLYYELINSSVMQ
jgi:hypothetical protein